MHKKNILQEFPLRIYWIKTEKEKEKHQVKEKIKGQEIHFDKAEGLSINGNPVFLHQRRQKQFLCL